MHFFTLAVLAVVVPVGFAIRCHVIPSPMSIDQPITSTAQDCPYPSLSCTKAVNMQTRTYTKACSYQNCTNQYGQPSNPGCYNLSTPYLEQYSCCCYGDGCNPASQTSFAIAGLTMIASFFF